MPAGRVADSARKLVVPPVRRIRGDPILRLSRLDRPHRHNGCCCCPVGGRLLLGGAGDEHLLPSTSGLDRSSALVAAPDARRVAVRGTNITDPPHRRLWLRALRSRPISVWRRFTVKQALACDGRAKWLSQFAILLTMPLAAIALRYRGADPVGDLSLCQALHVVAAGVPCLAFSTLGCALPACGRRIPDRWAGPLSRFYVAGNQLDACL